MQPNQTQIPQTQPVFTSTEAKTLPGPAHRNTGRRGNTVTRTTWTNANIRNTSAPGMLDSKATASLIWWRKEHIRNPRAKTTQQRTRRNQTIMSWQSCSRNLVGFFFLVCLFCALAPSAVSDIFIYKICEAASFLFLFCCFSSMVFLRYS